MPSELNANIPILVNRQVDANAVTVFIDGEQVTLTQGAQDCIRNAFRLAEDAARGSQAPVIRGDQLREMPA